MSKIRVFHLISGAEIVAEVEENDSGRSLLKPAQLAGKNIVPFMLAARGHRIPYPAHEHVLFVADARKELVKAYRQLTDSSTVQQAKKPGLMLPGGGQ